MQDTSVMPPNSVFIVILDEFLVARDIEMIIGDLKPDARVVFSRGLDDAAVRALQGRVEAAFVQRDAAVFLASAMGKRVVGDGGRLIFVGQERNEAPEGVAVLPFPFAREDVARLLAGETQA